MVTRPKPFQGYIELIFLVNCFRQGHFKVTQLNDLGVLIFFHHRIKALSRLYRADLSKVKWFRQCHFKVTYHTSRSLSSKTLKSWYFAHCFYFNWLQNTPFVSRAQAGSSLSDRKPVSVPVVPIRRMFRSRSMQHWWRRSMSRPSNMSMGCSSRMEREVVR